MATYLELDVDSIARIGLMFIDGDSLEEVLIDKVGHTDYDFDKFNRCKIPLMKIERMNPSLTMTAVLWGLRVTNTDLAEPLVAGNSLPFEGWAPSYVEPEKRRAFEGEFGVVKQHSAVCSSHYYPVKNSDCDIVGVLELIVGRREKVDL